MFNAFRTSRPSCRVIVAGLSLLLAGAVLQPAAAAPVPLSPYHAPPWLVAPGRPLTLAYALLDGSVTGTVYVRNSLQESFTRLPLARGPYCPGDPADAAAMRRDKVWVRRCSVGCPLGWWPARSSSTTRSCVTPRPAGRWPFRPAAL